MPQLHAIVDSLDTVPEAARSFYTETEDGRFKLDSDHEDVSGLKSALKKERTTRGELEKKVKAFGDLTPETLQEMRDRLSALEDEDGGSAGDKQKRKTDIKELREKIKAEVEREYSPYKTRAETAEAKLRDIEMSGRIRAAAVKAGVIEDDLDDVLTLTRGRFDLDEDGEIIVKDEKGQDSGLTPEKFFAGEFKEKRPKFFKAPVSSGSGARPDGGRPAVKSGGEKSSLDRISAGLGKRGFGR